MEYLIQNLCITHVDFAILIQVHTNNDNRNTNDNDADAQNEMWVWWVSPTHDENYDGDGPNHNIKRSWDSQEAGGGKGGGGGGGTI